jgi:hypothetical protein
MELLAEQHQVTNLAQAGIGEYKIYKQVLTQRTIYDHLMSIKGMDKFHSIPRPQTEYQEDMKDLKRSLYDRWIEDLTREKENDYEIEFYGEKQCDDFKRWMTKNSITNFETNSIKMALAVKRLKLPGVESGVRGGTKGNKTVYNIPALKAAFNPVGNPVAETLVIFPEDCITILVIGLLKQMV